MTERFLPPPRSATPVPIPEGFLLSVLIPVFNEKGTIHEIIRQVEAIAIPKEIIVVDDFSTDGTREMLTAMERPGLRVFMHEKNRGKGAALRTAISHIAGTHAVIQDADLEYDPTDYSVLLRPLLEKKADVVYGSRFMGERRVFYVSHYIGNIMLTWLTNILYSCTLTDMETCYKCFRADVIKGLNLESDRFTIEPEITAKVLKGKHRVFEVPITYAGRNFDEGKKITWRDGFSAIGALFKYRFKD